MAALIAMPIAGGVAANQTIRDALMTVSYDAGAQFVAPPMKYCTDNAAMIAGLADALHAGGVRHGMDLSAAARVTH